MYLPVFPRDAHSFHLSFVKKIAKVKILVTTSEKFPIPEQKYFKNITFFRPGAYFSAAFV